MDIETGLVKPRDLIVSLRAELAAERETVRGLQDMLANAVSADFHNKKMQELEIIADDATPIAGFISHLQARIAAEREIRAREIVRNTELALELAASQLSEQRLRGALGTVCEGWTLPPVARKILEDALWGSPTDTAALDAYVAEKVEPWKKDAERYKARRRSAMENHFKLCISGWGTEAEFISGYDRNTDAAIAAQEPKA